MPHITVRYFTSCPNWRIADQRIHAAVGDRDDVRIDYQLVETPEQAATLGFAGSPTILIDGIDLFAEPDQPTGLSCRVYRTPDGLAGSPTITQLEQALAVAEKGSARTSETARPIEKEAP